MEAITMSGKVVLITDMQTDDPGPIGLLLGALTEAGALAELVTDGHAGLRRAIGSRADLLVIDLDAPSLGGLDAQIQIGHIASRIPVLLLSAEDSKSRRMWAMGAGVVSYVTKPVDGQALMSLIFKVLRGDGS
jgi:DNA-binding response OmpR family regulator